VGYIEATADYDKNVMEAGDRFVTQVQSVLHPQSLAVVLLDQGGDTGRVAFTWGPPHQSETFQSASLAHVTGPVDISEHSLRINLEGREGTLGAVLFRGNFPNGHNHEQPLLLQAIIQQLALTLENIQLKERLRCKSVEDQVFENISALVAANLPPGPTYRRFAAEVKILIGHDRITIYLADAKSRDLSRTSQFGLGVPHSESGKILNLPGTGWESTVSPGQGLIIKDNAQPGPPVWPGLDGRADLRSALIAPVRYSGEVVGVVAAESRWPNAYGQVELSLLTKAAALLGPWIANSSLNNRLQGKANELAVMDGMGRAVGSLEGLEMVFGYLAEAVKELIPFEHATVTRIDSDGSDISALHWPGDASRAVYFDNADCRRLQTRLVFGKQEIGTLALTRENGLEFTSQDSRILKRLALQIAPVVQNTRLNRQGAQRGAQQARHIQLLKPSDPSLDPHSQGDGGAYREMPADPVQALRAPLTAIKGYSSALLQSDVSWPPEMYREFLETIDREADRLNQVVSRLSPTVEDQTDLVGLNLQNSSIEALFDKVQADLGLVDWAKAVEFRCEPGLALVPVDPPWLVQALGHLIRCAAEFTQADESIRVEACLRQGGPAIVIGTVKQARPGGTTRGGQQGNSVHRDGRPARKSLINDFRVVISRTLLGTHGVSLRMTPQGRPTEIFWFSIPHC